MACTQRGTTTPDELQDPTLFKMQSEEQVKLYHSTYTFEAITSSQLAVSHQIPIVILEVINDYIAISHEEAKRQIAISELLTTEYKYLKLLRHYKQYYIDGLDGNTDILGKEEYDIVCPKEIWNNLITLHSVFYDQLHAECMKYTYWSAGICRVFEDVIISHGIHFYESYVHHYYMNRVNHVVSYEHPIDHKWNKFMEYDFNVASLKEIHLLSQSLLVSPVSRMAVYSQIMQNIEKHTEEGSVRKEHLNRMMRRFQQNLQTMSFMDFNNIQM